MGSLHTTAVSSLFQSFDIKQEHEVHAHACSLAPAACSRANSSCCDAASISSRLVASGLSRGLRHLSICVYWSWNAFQICRICRMIGECIANQALRAGQALMERAQGQASGGLLLGFNQPPTESWDSNRTHAMTAAQVASFRVACMIGSANET